MQRRTFLQGLGQVLAPSGPFTRLLRSAGAVGALGLGLDAAAHAASAWACQCGVCPRCIGDVGPAIAFYYGADIPVDDLRAFDWAVLDPDHALRRDRDIASALGPQTTAVAYLSLGEVNPSRSYASDIPAAWVRTHNITWDSRVIDQAAAGWPAFVREHMVQPLWDAGFHTFFLDTLDSYQSAFDEGDRHAINIPCRF